MTDLNKNPRTQSYITPQIFVIDPAKDNKSVMEQELFQQNPQPRPTDITTINSEQISIKIDQVRQLTQELSYAGLSTNPRYIIILSAHLFTVPAQNALLKLLEEPPVNTHIWLCTAYPELLLPTIHSRCRQQLRISQPTPTNSVKLASEVSTTKLDEKLADVLQLAELSHRELIDLAEQYKDRSDAQNYLTQVLQAAHQLLATNPADLRYVKVLELLLTAHQQLAANTNPRLTLEHLFFACKQALLPDIKPSK